MPVSAAHVSAIHSAADLGGLFRLLGHDVGDLTPFEGAALDDFEFDAPEAAVVRRATVLAQRDAYTVWLYEVTDLSAARLRGLAWHALQRGTGLLVVTTDYRELLLADPRFAGGKANKSAVRVNRLKFAPADVTRHDLDTLNALDAHGKTGDQIYAAQAEAFNVTRITKRFYDQYRAVYERAHAAIAASNPHIRAFDEPDKLHAYTQRLLGRLMFLYFLQRKGWLGGRLRFLTEQYRATFQRHSGEDHSGETHYFYREVLEPLFFETLNRQRPGHITQWEGVRIPYLNGGLFDPARDPEGALLLPDSLFDPINAGGLLEFFNRFNFTVADDTPLEQDVAVDPEMLGKVFENMLEERDRGQSGSFYTPRPIVSYMCQEALAGYLDERGAIPRETARALFDPDAGTGLTPEQAAAIDSALATVTVLDPAVGSGSFLIGMMNEILWLKRRAATARGLAITPEIVAGWKEAIIRDSLYGVDIKPEAIEIAQLRLWLALVVDQTLDQARPLPNLDYKLMAGNSLIETLDGEPVLTESAEAMLGEDVDPAQFALFDLGPEQEPLELFGPEPRQQTLGMFGSDRERRNLNALRRRFFAAGPDERKALRADLQAQERRIVQTALEEKSGHVQTAIIQLGKKAGANNGLLGKADQKKLDALAARQTRLLELIDAVNQPGAPLPFFLYHLHFSEVFAHGGFDIVVANPPYVRGELLGGLKDELKETAIYKGVYAGTADLYVYFYARAIDLLRPNGQLSFITSNKYLRANYGRGLRGFLSRELRLNAVVDFGDLPVFEAAAYPCIVLGDKCEPDAEAMLSVLAVEDVVQIEDLREWVLTSGMTLQSELTAGGWNLSSGPIARVMAKLRAAGVPLGEYVKGRIYRGVLTGLNEAFVIDAETRSALIAADPRSAEVIKPWLRGRDVKRWTVNYAGLYVIFARQGININQYPAIRAHLEQYRARLTPGVEGGRKPGTYKWYELQDTIAYYAEFEKPKIMLPDIAPSPRFAFDRDNFYIGNTGYIIPADEGWLLAVLNSTAIHFFYDKVSTQIRGGFYRFIYQYLAEIPIPNPPAPLRAQIAALAQQCLDAAGSHPEKLPALEAKLNALVYEAYGLDEEDVKVIEGSVGGGK